MKQLYQISVIGVLIFINIKSYSQGPRQQSRSKMQNSELLINSTVKIESIGESYVNNQPRQYLTTGTAFFYTYKIGNFFIPVLVTNLHSVKNSVISKILFTENDTLTNPTVRKTIEYINNNFQNRWIPHPEYDLAILPFNPILEAVKKDQHKDILFVAFDESVIPVDSVIRSLSAIEQLLMIGYPKGYGDSFNNYPIVRRGTTATPLFSNFNNKNEFLLDIPIYSGSSGSPVILSSEGGYSNNGSFVVGGNRTLLTGIATQSVDLRNPSAASTLGLENSLNIAVVIKASSLLDFKPILTNLLNEQQRFLNNQKK
jgi:hypothetical protein